MQQIPSITIIVATVAAVAGASAQEPTWNRTLDGISSGVVSIQVDSTRAFDTERNQSTQATGFVVDAERGLILTNRHVVTPGPVVAQAIFLNQEEVDLVPVYRDPVHDFGFFRYDPSELRFIDPSELALVPEAAQIGLDIRVIGNDAGEQLSILAGTIARLDRQAPNYGRGNYNDFNTFYFQAASGTSGGSSGSPVIDIEGRVVALNAGANTQAASSFFLPLDRIRRALTLIRSDENVPRGTLQSEFVNKPYAELRRLGLTEESEAAMREVFPDQTGLLVVQRVVPGAGAGSFLQPGDILLRIDGELIAKFVPLAVAFDENVGNRVLVEIERGGVVMQQALLVDDLHQITSNEFIEYGEGVFHNLSYQQARHFNRNVSGVYVADPGYVFGSSAIPRASLITSIDGQTMESLDDFQRVLEALPEGQRASVRFLQFDDPRNERQRSIRNNRRWFAAQRCQRDDELGLWPCQAIAEALSVQQPPTGATTFPLRGDPHVQHVTPSLVLVNFDMPYTVSGVSDRHYYGTGVIADAERGWVVVDRNTVPVALGDVRLTFAGSLEIPGSVEYIHPLHNLAGNLFGCRGRTSWLSTELVAEVLQVLPDVKGDDLLAVNSHKFLQQRMLQQLMYGGNISQFRRHRVDGPGGEAGAAFWCLLPSSTHGGNRSSVADLLEVSQVSIATRKIGTIQIFTQGNGIFAACFQDVTNVTHRHPFPIGHGTGQLITYCAVGFDVQEVLVRDLYQVPVDSGQGNQLRHRGLQPWCGLGELRDREGFKTCLLILADQVAKQVLLVPGELGAPPLEPDGTLFQHDKILAGKPLEHGPQEGLVIDIIKAGVQ